MNKLSGAILCGILLFPSEAISQQLPANQVWLAAISAKGLGEPELISPSGGYHNQPMFSPDSSTVYFTSEQQDGQTDVARYVIAQQNLTLVSSSPESEYSPTPIPGDEAVSVIRVELPEQRQRLWRLSIVDGSASVLMTHVEPVGYHTWLDEQTAAVFILGDSFTLQKAVTGDGPAEWLADNIGRTLRKHPATGQVLFVDKNVAPWAIASFDLENRDQSQVMALFPNVEDFEVDSSGRYWMGFGSKLYRSNESHTGWELIEDFQRLGMNNITRLASSPDGLMLAIVASP